MSTTSYVYTGLWQNKQYNSIEGATLTLSSTQASYLVAFLALFLGIVAGHFWAILSFAVFHIRSTLALRGGSHHQQQAILRNYHAPGAAIWQLILLFWSSRTQKGFKAIYFFLPVISLALISLMAFAAAGILSARVTSKQSDVLIKNTQPCGFWRPDTDSADNADNTGFDTNLAEDFGLAATMASACSKNSSIASDCVSYAPREIEWTTSTNISCPFDKKICYKGLAVRFDTGLFDTTAHLGINSDARDRVQHRMVAECSPLVREGYVRGPRDMNGTRIHSSKGILTTYPNEKYTEMMYGRSRRLGLNATFIFSDREPTVLLHTSNLWNLGIEQAELTMEEDVGIEPIPELNRTDADVQYLFLRQEMGLQYSAPVNDPWFEATSPGNITIKSESGPVNTTIYSPNFPVSAVACAMQYQWCEPNTKKCTQLTGRIPAVRQGFRLIRGPSNQAAVFSRMMTLVSNTAGIQGPGIYLGGSSLLMNRIGPFQIAAPADNQWIRELNHMFGTMLKVTQIRNYRYTGGYTSAFQIKPIINVMSFANWTWMCDAQTIRREDYQSLSVLGVATICAVGALIIVINLTLDTLVTWYQKRFNKHPHAMREWEMLQAEKLQRNLYKAHRADWRENDVSVEKALDAITDGGTVNPTSAGKEGQGELKSMSSVGTFAKGDVNVGVRRVSTERTLPTSQPMMSDRPGDQEDRVGRASTERTFPVSPLAIQSSV